MDFIEAFNWMMEEPKSRKIIEAKFKYMPERFKEGVAHDFLFRGRAGTMEYFCILPFRLLSMLSAEELSDHYYRFTNKKGKYEKRIENLLDKYPEVSRYFALQFAHIAKNYAELKSRIPSIKKWYPKLSYDQILFVLINYNERETIIKELQRGAMKRIMLGDAIRLNNSTLI